MNKQKNLNQQTFLWSRQTVKRDVIKMVIYKQNGVATATLYIANLLLEIEHVVQGGHFSTPARTREIRLRTLKGRNIVRDVCELFYKDTHLTRATVIHLTHVFCSSAFNPIAWLSIYVWWKDESLCSKQGKTKGLSINDWCLNASSVLVLTFTLPTCAFRYLFSTMKMKLQWVKFLTCFWRWC